MKRFFLNSLVLLMSLYSFIACAKTEEEEKASFESVDTYEESTQEIVESDEVTVPSDEKGVTILKVPGKDIYVDCDDSYRVTEQSRTMVVYDDNESLVGFTFNKSDTYEGALDGVVEFLNEKYMNNISGYSSGYLKESHIEILSSTQTTLAGFDCIQFTGEALNEMDEPWKCHVYGYAFIIDGVPCAVIGLVSAQAQDAEMIAETDALVDEIASTIRTKK